MSNESEREAFENWCECMGYNTGRVAEGYYALGDLNKWWDVWQACAALHCKHDEGHHGDPESIHLHLCNKCNAVVNY
jgi:hypothetical protein